eukprot:Tamp_14271.p1 GENE.Tamp_14271~~Tamp_14271.p1  ORF type:complete len:121 (-),score=0.07 Tamp_14271:854-1216(-)
MTHWRTSEEIHHLFLSPPVPVCDPPGVRVLNAPNAAQFPLPSLERPPILGPNALYRIVGTSFVVPASGTLGGGGGRERQTKTTQDPRTRLRFWRLTQEQTRRQRVVNWMQRVTPALAQAK